MLKEELDNMSNSTDTHSENHETIVDKALKESVRQGVF